ncbi:DUF1569 domain-containing protein [Flavobacterium sp. RSSA_27]|uniref:DUF1569 domain-containing protein n=1 Tax=Flavobacterium sp. RSSA_27 TaxID=3447667 RepID=UPI003F33DD34
MPSIYTASDNAILVERIQNLNTNSTPLWGKMSVDQMCEHCIAAINVAFGKQDLTISFPMRLLGRLLKNKAFNSDFGKNSPTAKEFRITGHSDFEKSQTQLIACVQEFAKGTSVIKVMQHPFWGKMSYEDWDKLMYRHLDHHLRQFGV